MGSRKNRKLLRTSAQELVLHFCIFRREILFKLHFPWGDREWPNGNILPFPITTLWIEVVNGMTRSKYLSCDKCISHFSHRNTVYTNSLRFKLSVERKDWKSRETFILSQPRHAASRTIHLLSVCWVFTKKEVVTYTMRRRIALRRGRRRREN